MTDPFKNEYNFSSLKKIALNDFSFYVTPRFEAHYKDRDYEKLTVELFKALLDPNGSVIDIGAHYGYYSLLAAQGIGKNGKVISVEPVPFNETVLAKNIKENGLNNVTVKRCAVSNKKDTAVLNITEASDNAGFYDHPNTRILKKVKVNTITLDSLTEGLDSISVIKIDAEGHENKILEGARKTLRDKSLRLIFEFNPKCFRAASEAPEKILKTLMDLGLCLYFIDDKKYLVTKLKTPSSWKNMMGELEYRNVFVAAPEFDKEFSNIIKKIGASYVPKVSLPNIFKKLSTSLHAK